MKKILVILHLIILVSCNKDNNEMFAPENENKEFISAVDISQFPEISSTNPTFKDVNGNQKELIDFYKFTLPDHWKYGEQEFMEMIKSSFLQDQAKWVLEVPT